MSSAGDIWHPGRLWGLLDMMDYKIGPICRLFAGLKAEELCLQLRVAAPRIEDSERARYEGIVTSAEAAISTLDLEAAKHRIELFRKRLKAPHLTCHQLEAEVRGLREAIEGELKNCYFYYYPQYKAKMILNLAEDWKAVAERFPKMQPDIIAAVDCFAIGRHNACVFHLMRAMESAVQAFGKKLGVNITKKNPGKRVSELTWDQILSELNPKLKGLPQSTIRQKRRYEKISGIQSHLYAVKDAWRNPTMHPRDAGYNELQAADILNHVHSFMNGLAEAI